MATAREARAEVMEVTIPLGAVALRGVLSRPPDAQGVVVFAHGGGSGRASPRNRAIAGTLVRAGFATLLLDLLTPDERAEDGETGRHRFDMRLQSERVVGAIDWLGETAAADLPLGCFGASTGAAAALIAAAERRERVRAIVARSGRTDLAGAAIEHVHAPTLLIAGSLDTDTIRHNHAAQSSLCEPCRLEIVPGAGTLFEEPGALERVAQLARGWFERHLAAERRADAA
jgi:dienelactone hydrolase